MILDMAKHIAKITDIKIAYTHLMIVGICSFDIGCMEMYKIFKYIHVLALVHYFIQLMTAFISTKFFISIDLGVQLNQEL